MSNIFGRAVISGATNPRGSTMHGGAAPVPAWHFRPWLLTWLMTWREAAAPPCMAWQNRANSRGASTAAKAAAPALPFPLSCAHAVRRLVLAAGGDANRAGACCGGVLWLHYCRYMCQVQVHAASRLCHISLTSSHSYRGVFAKTFHLYWIFEHINEVLNIN